MNLKKSQKNTLKAHLSANTNTTPSVDSQGQPLITPFVINQGLAGRDSEKQRAIAEWYMGNALANDNQPFASLFIWNPRVTEVMLSTAIDWSTVPPHGLGGSPTIDQQQLAIGNKWWLWDAMIGRKGYINFTDAQARNGVVAVWGNIGPANTNSTTSSAIGSETINPLVAKLNARRIELVFNSNAVGNKTAWNAAIVCPTGLNGSPILGQPLTANDIDDVLLNGV